MLQTIGTLTDGNLTGDVDIHETHDPEDEGTPEFMIQLGESQEDGRTFLHFLYFRAADGEIDVSGLGIPVGVTEYDVKDMIQGCLQGISYYWYNT